MPWRVVSSGAAASPEAPALRPRRIAVQLVLSVLFVLVLVALVGAFAARRLAEREAVNDAASKAGVLAQSVVQPAFTDGLVRQEPAAIATFDALVRSRVLGGDIVRVKIWSPAGGVLYADEPQLIGKRFALTPDQREALTTPSTRAEISSLSESENEFETGGRLVEVYRPVWTATGSPALFEMYTSYDPVGARTTQLWRGFGGVTLSSLLFLVVLVSPIVWHLIQRLQRAEQSRRQLLERAVEVSADERRRIAATLHDGPVQDLAATSFAVSGAAAQAENRGDAAQASALSAAAGSVRSSIRALRTLLVDIYPAALGSAGLPAALNDLADGLRSDEIHVATDIGDEELGLSEGQERLVYRVAQECLRNAVEHAGPATVTVSLHRAGPRVVLEVHDDGAGFDAAALLNAPVSDHFGLRLLSDAGSAPGCRLEVASAPGSGAHWRLLVDIEGGTR